MEQKTLNERIAMAMLRQCALVWEHCVSTTTNFIDGKFCLADVKRGAYGKTSDRQKSKIGMIDVDVEHPKWEGAFRLKVGQIEGVTLSYDNYIKLTVEGFSCGYWLDRVFEIAYDFCSSVGCPSLGNKMVFGWDNGERYAILPDVQQPKPKKSKSKAKVVKHQPSDIKPQTSAMTLAEQLRQALLAKLAA